MRPSNPLGDANHFKYLEDGFVSGVLFVSCPGLSEAVQLCRNVMTAEVWGTRELANGG